jgi:hypothetical protein
VAKTALDRLEALKKEIYSEYGIWGEKALLHSVQKALAQPAPRGSVAVIEAQAAAVRAAGRECDHQRGTTQVYVKEPLPDLWTGTAGRQAGASIAALDNELRRAVEAFDQAAVALDRVATAAGEAVQLDHAARGHLESAATRLNNMLVEGPSGYDSGTMKEAHHEAMTGIAAMVTAARHLKDASQLAVRQLRELSARAHAARLTSTGFTDLDRLVLADVSGASDGPHDANLILTADAASRASARLDQLNADDRRRFESLLGGSRSAEERAYLLQALAAGYSLAAIGAFDSKIHDHAKDSYWLQHHLRPIDERGGPEEYLQRSVDFKGEEWTQGSDPTCVAMSTVMARARVDPLYALQLTTGGHPGDPAFDNGDAFAQRLHDEQHRVYDDGRNWLQDLFHTDGMTDGQARDVANEEVGAHTGASYHEVQVHSAGDRRGVLLDVETAVDKGLPVTFSVHGGGQGHEMAIVGHQGDMLEVYNPWGYTIWISEDDFVNNHMNVVGDGVPSTLHAVNVPSR